MLDTTMVLAINNKDGSVPNDRIWVSIISETMGKYLDLRTGTLEDLGKYKSGVTSTRLSDIPGGTVNVPAIKSGRIYFFIGQDADETLPSSGPSPSKPLDGSNPPGAGLFFDKVEFDTSAPGFYNINQTNVDMYGFSFMLSIPQSGGPPITRGISARRSEVIARFKALPVPAGDPRSGNPVVFRNLLAQDLERTNIVRVISPSGAGYMDCSADPTPTIDPDAAARVSRYFDEYVTQHCFKPNRELSFQDKLGNPMYGKVDEKGQTLSLYDGQRKPYSSVPTLVRPVSGADWPQPMNDPAKWQGVTGDKNGVDWGFVIAGAPQAGLPKGSAAWGWVLPVSDPAVMAIAISICRGVMHEDDGAKWRDSSNYYQGAGGKNTADMPIDYYGQILHSFGLDGAIYAFSYDDVYGKDSNVKFGAGATVTIDLMSIETVSP